MTIEHEDAIVRPFVLKQFLHKKASRRTIQDGSSKKFYFGEHGHLDYWEQFLKLLTTREKLTTARPKLIIAVFFGLASSYIRIGPMMRLCTSLRTDSAEPPIVASTR